MMNIDENKVKLLTNQYIARLRPANAPLRWNHPGGFNSQACAFLDVYSEYKGLKLQHALNGGELNIVRKREHPISGNRTTHTYKVDGYDKEKNVIVEYYEQHHRGTVQKEHDIERNKYIIETMGCKFIIIREIKGGYEEEIINK